MTRTGPVRYTDGPLTTEPRLITSFADFERVYGGLERLQVTVDDAGTIDERECYVAHATQASSCKRPTQLFVQASGL